MLRWVHHNRLCFNLEVPAMVVVQMIHLRSHLRLPILPRHQTPQISFTKLLLKIYSAQIKQYNNSVLYNAHVQRVREEQILKHQQQRENVWSNNQSKDFIIQQQKQNGFSGVNVGAYLENEKSVWPSLQCMMQQNQQKRSGNGGSGNGHLSNVKKPSAGTGATLLYGSSLMKLSGLNRKIKMTGCSTTSLHGLGERSYPHAIGGGHALPQWQPRRGGGLCSDYELQLAHKNAMLMHRRSSHLHQQVAISHELGLPQEWTY
ncbi:hypothetical protein Leryth_007448 [Lithospermum erythrorhizon]|nr:hypothetical protein Leryth_007448 [Lithospermum erythrorhizon]